MSIYSNTSPYFTTPIQNGYLDILNLRDIPQLSDDILFEIVSTYQYRPDLLAYDIYKDHKLWWVFSVRNKDVLKDPIFDMIAGRKIFLPKLSVIRKSIGI